MACCPHGLHTPLEPLTHDPSPAPVSFPLSRAKDSHFSKLLRVPSGVTKLGQQVPLQIVLPTPKCVLPKAQRPFLLHCYLHPRPAQCSSSSEPSPSCRLPSFTTVGLGNDPLSFRSPQFLNFKLLPNTKPFTESWPLLAGSKSLIY